MDSGADFSVIRGDIAEMFAKEKSIAMGPAARTAVAAGGEALDVYGSISADLKIGDKIFLQEMAVSKNIIYDIVLGRDFCCSVGLVLDDRQAIIQIDEMVIPMPTYEEVRPSRARVRFDNSVTVPARSTCMAMAKLDPIHGTWGALSQSQIEGLLEPNHRAFQEGIAVPRIVSAVEFREGTGSVPVRLFNYGEEDAKILKGMDIGTFHVSDQKAGASYQICDNKGGDETKSCQGQAGLPPGIDLDNCSLSDSGKNKLRSLFGKFLFCI